MREIPWLPQEPGAPELPSRIRNATAAELADALCAYADECEETGACGWTIAPSCIAADLRGIAAALSDESLFRWALAREISDCKAGFDWLVDTGGTYTPLAGLLARSEYLFKQRPFRSAVFNVSYLNGPPV